MECRITFEYQDRLRNGAGAGEFGRLTADAWAAIAEQLNPVLGLRGVQSLARRCVRIATAHHPWLAEITYPQGDHLQAQSLIETFSRQPPEQAAAGGALLLTTLNELLASLVGASLTERLLQPVWNDFQRGTHTQGDAP